jgi:hypothetical protein
VSCRESPDSGFIRARSKSSSASRPRLCDLRTREPGTLQYETYFNDNESEAMVLERYRDSQAHIDHGQNMAHLMSRSSRRPPSPASSSASSARSSGADEGRRASPLLDALHVALVRTYGATPMTSRNDTSDRAQNTRPYPGRGPQLDIPRSLRGRRE